MIKIPNELQDMDINFVLLEKKGKKPFQKDWQKKEIKWTDPDLAQHLEEGGNYGVLGGGKRSLVIVDFDNEEVQEQAIQTFPETFTVKTGSGLLHKYFFCDKAESFKIFTENMDTIADIQGQGKQVVGPSSIHPNGNLYEVVANLPITTIEYAELKAIMMFFDEKPKKEKEIEMEKSEEHNNTFLELIKSKLPIEKVLSQIGVDTTRNPCQCPFHGSKGGKCLGFKDETAHCFHCDGSWNIFSLIKQYKKIDFKETIEWLSEVAGLQAELEQSRKDYIQQKRKEMNDETQRTRTEFIELTSGKEKDWGQATELLAQFILNKNHLYTIKEDTKNEIWIYDDGVYVPNGKSEIKLILRKMLDSFYSMFVFNKVVEKIEPDTYIDGKDFFSNHSKTEIPVLNGLLNLETLELNDFDPTKVFFNKMPVTYDAEKKCPMINKFLQDVLTNPEDIKVFYEIMGFGLLSEYKYEKAVMMVGDGRNGKGKSIELMKRLVGVDNCCSLPLSSILPDSFQISELFGKKLNLAGDIGNNDLKDTSMFKSLTGRDLVTAKRKFLNGLNFENYATFVFACNELPMVYDMTRGFWDRWILLEFPYTFVNQEEFDKAEDKKFLKIKDENIIHKITTDHELSGFLNLALQGLHRLTKIKNFSVTKGSAEVKSTWIRKSNSFIAFCYDNMEQSYDSFITKKQLRMKYIDFCKKHLVNPKSDYVIKRVLQETFGATEEKINTTGFTWEWVWSGIKSKDINNV